MENQKSKKILSLIVLLTYLIMVSVNGLANALPINGMNTGSISDSYPNMFAPAGITFIIWGVIYILLFGFSIYQLANSTKIYEKPMFKSIGIWFAFSSVINSCWIFAWHYKMIWLSLIFMIVILISLIRINMNLRNIQLSKQEIIFLRIPFSVYFGWITVATIANTTTFLVAINWSKFGVSEVLWTDVIILVGAIIGFAAIRFYRSISYGLVIIWAYIGIAIKHISPDYFNSQYTSVIISVIVSIILIIVGEAFLIKSKIEKKGEINEQ